MASVHGAGLMRLPFVMPTPQTEVLALGHEHALYAAAAPTSFALAAMASAAHTLAYLAVTTLVAYVVYRRLGLAVLRTAWFNLDWSWAGALG